MNRRIVVKCGGDTSFMSGRPWEWDANGWFPGGLDRILGWEYEAVDSLSDSPVKQNHLSVLSGAAKDLGRAGGWSQVESS